MATLKDHQQAMVDLLASGSGIPASASRLAHAMHDVLEMLLNEYEIERCGSVIDRLIIEPANPTPALKELMNRRKETTPGLNDKALAGDIEACRPKATPAERRVKELENTIRQLKVRNVELKVSRDAYKAQAEKSRAKLLPEQAGCRKDDTQVDWSQCQHDYVYHETISARRCLHCGDVQK